MWRDLSGDIKYFFVIKSRLEEEKAWFEAKSKMLKEKIQTTPIKEDPLSLSADWKSSKRSPLKDVTVSHVEFD